MHDNRASLSFGGDLPALLPNPALRPGGGSASLTAATVTVPYGSYDYRATITDASVTGASKVMILPGLYAQTDTNTPNDAVFNVESVGAGSFTVRLASPGRESIGGPFKFLYLLG